MTQPMTEKPTGEEKRAFMVLALVGAKGEGFIQPEESDLRGDRLLSLYRQWGGDGWLQNFKPINAKLDELEAAANFVTWLKKKAGAGKLIIKRELVIDRVSVRVTIPLGERGSVTFGAEGYAPDQADDDELKECYGQLFHAAWNGYHEFKDHPPTLNIRKPYSPTNGAGQDMFEYTSIRVAVDGSKRSYFCKGGKFGKFGVRVFPNILVLGGYDVESMTGETFTGGKAIYTIKANGEPDLVISVQKGIDTL